MRYLALVIVIIGLLYAGLYFRPQFIRELPLANTNQAATSTAGTDIPDQTPPAATSTASVTLAVADLLAQANRYNGQQLCVSGYYETTFEFSALSASFHLDDKQRRQIDKPYIWVETSVPRTQLQCLEPSQGLYCFGAVTICGLFEVAPAGDKGFGQLGLYRYQLRQ